MKRKNKSRVVWDLKTNGVLQKLTNSNTTPTEVFQIPPKPTISNTSCQNTTDSVSDAKRGILAQIPHSKRPLSVLKVLE